MAKKKSVRKKIKKQNLFDKYFLLSWKKILLIIVAWFVAVILHNVIYGVIKYFNPAFTGDEAFFFIIAIIVIPLYFIISLIYSLIKGILYLVKKKM